MSVGALAAIATVGVQIIGTGDAFAHANAVTGAATCGSDGSYTVTWTVANDYQSPEDVTVTSNDPASSVIAPTSVHIDAVKSGQIVQTGVPGDSRSAALTVKGVWTVDGYTQPNSGTVTLDGTCHPTHVAKAPTSSDGTCSGATTAPGTVTIPADTGVVYTLDGTTRSAGTYPVDAGRHEVVASSTVYQLTGLTDFVLNVSAPPASCLTTVQPRNPTVWQAECAPGSGTPGAPTIAPASTDGVTYSVAPHGPYEQGQTVTVTAVATPGHEFGATPPAGWTRVDATHETFVVTFAPVTCIHTVTPQAPTITQSACTSTGDASAPTLTLATTSGITYTASPTGGYAAGGQVVVTAVADRGDRFDNPAPTGWTFVDASTETYTVTFASAPHCARAAAPTFWDDHCGGNAVAGATYEIPATTGVVYEVGGVVVPAGTYRAVDGATVVVTAVAQSGYVITGPTEFTHTFSAAPDCRTAVMPVPPTFTPAACAGSHTGGATYTIPASVGVDYYVDGARTLAGTYPAVDGSTVIVTAQARDGYLLTGTTMFVFTYPAAPDCTTGVTPAAPTFVDQVCTVGHTTQDAGYTIPATVGVVYLVNGAVVAAGSYPAQAGSTVVVTTRADDGYRLTGTSTFTHTFASDPSCTAPVQVAAPGFDPARCAGATPELGTYTIPSETGVDFLVDVAPSGAAPGSHAPVLKAAGTYTAPQLSTVTVTARAQSGYTVQGKTTYVYRYAPSVTCGSELVPASATFDDPVCLSATRSSAAAYVIPVSVGAAYFVGTTRVAAGSHPWQAGGTVTVVARAVDGYTLTGVTQWTHRFTSTVACGGTDSVTTPNPVGRIGSGGYTGSYGSGSPADTGTPVALLLSGGVVFLLVGAFLILLAGRRRSGDLLI